MRLFFVGAHALSLATGLPLKVAYLATVFALGIIILAMRINKEPIKLALVNSIISWLVLTIAMLGFAYIVETFTS